MSNTKDWATLYAPTKIKSWGLPATDILRPDDGVFSKLYTKWSELSQDPEIDLYTICTDVLLIDIPVVITRSTYLFARRIEIGPNGSLTLERIEEPVALVLAANEVVAASNGAAQQLNIKVHAENGTSTASYGGSTGPGINVLEWEDDPAARRYDVNQLDEDYLQEGESLRVHLRCIFQLAVLLSTDDPELSVRQLNWVASLATCSEDTRTIGGQARALAANLQAINAEKGNTLLVPDLDYSVYSKSANAFLELLNRRQQKQDTLNANVANATLWLNAAEDALKLNESDEALNAKLLTKSKATREQVLDARATIARQIALQRLVLFSCEKNFEAGVKIWKRKEIAKNILKMVTGIMKILSALPTMVVAGPSMGLSAGMSALSATVNLAIKAGGMSIGDKSKAPMAPSAGSGAAALKANALDTAKAQGWDPADPGTSLTWKPIGGNGLPEVRPPVNNDLGSDLLFSDRTVDEIQTDYDAARNDELKKGREVAKGLALQRKYAQAEFNKGVAEIGSGAQEIMAAGMAISDTIQKAEKLTDSAQAALLSSNNAVDTAFSSIDLQGIDVVTGGAQVWDNLALAIDNFFENNNTLGSIYGGKAYRTEMRRLIMMGKTFAQTRLAVAKADAELAEMLMRKAASERNVAIYQSRKNQLGAAAANDNTIAQLAFGKVLDAKRAVYLAMESYRRAFIYFTLVKEEDAPSLPKFTDSVDEFNRVGANIVGNLLADVSLKKIGEAPQSIPNNAYDIPIADLPSLLVTNGGMMLPIATTSSQFNGMGRIRLNRVRVFAKGLKANGNVNVRIATSGHYEDKTKDGRSVAFASTPRKMNFIYDGNDHSIIRQDGDIARRYEDDFFHPTPFTNWTIQFSSQQGEALDFSTITSLRIEFSGESSSI